MIRILRCSRSLKFLLHHSDVYFAYISSSFFGCAQISIASRHWTSWSEGKPTKPTVAPVAAEKVGGQFFCWEVLDLPPPPRIASHQLESLLGFAGDPEKKQTFICHCFLGGWGGVDLMFGQFSPTSMVDVRFLLATRHPPFSPISVAAELCMALELIQEFVWVEPEIKKGRSFTHLRLAQASRSWIEMDRHTSTCINLHPEN